MKKQREQKTFVPRSLRRLFPKINFTDVVDSREAVEVTVREEDCQKGRRLKPAECAMAQAARRQYKADAVVIGLGISYIIQGTKAVRFKTPDTVQREVVSFDRHHDFAPGQYSLSPISPSGRLGLDHRHRTGRRSNARIVHHQTARVRVLEK